MSADLIAELLIFFDTQDGGKYDRVLAYALRVELTLQPGTQ